MLNHSPINHKSNSQSLFLNQNGDSLVKVSHFIFIPNCVLTIPDPMITNLNLATHPGLNISRHFKMDIPASSTLTQQSITINLPTTHYYLQVNPVISPALLDRQHKVFVTCGSRLHALPLINGQPIDPQNAVYDARLHPGVNRIEVEIIAALPKGAKPINGQDYETEKFTVFANLIKA